LDWFYKLDISVIYAAAIVLIAGAAEFGTWTGLRHSESRVDKSEIHRLAFASLGLLALLIAFSFSMAITPPLFSLATDTGNRQLKETRYCAPHTRAGGCGVNR
jgi:uncharacterized protein YacL